MRRRRILAVACLVLDCVVLGAPHEGSRHGLALEPEHAGEALVRNDILAGSSAVPLTETHGSNHNKRHKKRKDPMELPPERQKVEDEYNAKFHDDDEYAQWAKDPDLGRGPNWSKVFRMTLYANPGRPS